MGDDGAVRLRFEAVYTQTYSQILGYALRRTASPSDAADVVAETYLTAWRRIDDVPPGDEARPWLYGVARRVLANHHRGDRRRTALAARLATDLDELALPAPTEDSVAVRRAFARLKPDDQEVLALATWESLDRDEIAVVLDCTRASVRVRLHRARRRLAAELEAEGLRPQRSAPGGHVLAVGMPAPEETP